MFDKRVDRIYRLCKRVMDECPDMHCTFEMTSYGIHVRLFKDKNKLGKQKPDLTGCIYTNPQVLKAENERNYKKIRETLLEVLEERERQK